MILTCQNCGIKHNKKNPLRYNRETKKGLCLNCKKIKIEKTLKICKELSEKFF